MHQQEDDLEDSALAVADDVNLDVEAKQQQDEQNEEGLDFAALIGVDWAIAPAADGSVGRQTTPRRKVDSLDAAKPLPQPTVPLPRGVVPKVHCIHTRLHLGQPVDVKELATRIRSATFKPQPRMHTSIRLVQCRATVTVRPIGCAHIVCYGGFASEDAARLHAARVSKLVIRLAQQCFPGLKTEAVNLQSVELRVLWKLPCTVRLEALTDAWSDNSLYNPEVTSKAAFRVPLDDCAITLEVFVTGKVLATVPNLVTGTDALERFYPLVLQYCH